MTRIADPMLRSSLLIGGLVLYGVSMAMMITSGLGLDPWDVFHEGLGHRLPLSFGAVTAVTGVVVLLAWIPLRERPGIGTVANVVVIAITVDGALKLMPPADGHVGRATLLIGGVVLNGLATASYISAGLGAGPRDGLMTGIVARTGLSVRLVRTGIEATVLAAGWILGGTAGVGTVFYALAIGPLVQFFLHIVPARFLADRAGNDHSSGDFSPGDNSEPADRMPTDTP